MNNQQHQQTLSHDRIIAKLQHFADMLQQSKLEKEALSIALGECKHQTEIRNTILIYEEILGDYYDEFQEILMR